jgi:hypothetical protein
MQPKIGWEYRQLDSYQDVVQATDAGASVKGRKDNLHFYLDARITSESRESSHLYSYDREFYETQNADEFARFTYISYPRYKASLSLDFPFGDLGFRRDALQWGPGIFHNLSFNSQAIPFNHFYYKGKIGPVRVMSLWGQLSLDSAQSVNSHSPEWNSDYRHVYAHRYEWNILQDLMLGITEQLIVYNDGAPAALIPIAPLFMEKGQVNERNNNGNIAIDLSYRLPKWGLFYTEFLVDDLQDPGTLFDDFWGNRWAWMAGAHLARDWHLMQWGLIAEYARVEPWVYTHYYPQTAQSAHRGYPLGEQLGPNSQTITTKLYLRENFSWTTGIRMDWIWKGTDPGSNVEDAVYDYNPVTKEFLAGVGGPVFKVGPSATYRWKNLQADSYASLDNDGQLDFVFRLMGSL